MPTWIARRSGMIAAKKAIRKAARRSSQSVWAETIKMGKKFERAWPKALQPETSYRSCL
jgi:hypothetical protein